MISKTNLIQYLCCIMLVCNSTFAQPFQFLQRNKVNISTKASEIKFLRIDEDTIPDFFLRYQAADTQFGWLSGKQIKSSLATEYNIPKPDNYALTDFGYLNADTIPDMVTSSYWNNGFLVYLGLGRGLFSAGQFYQSGVHGNRVAIVDINNDNKNDVVTVTSGSGQPIVLHVFIGDGMGALTRSGSFSTGSATPRNLFVLDKNKDGLLDVLVTSSFPEFVIFFQQEDLKFKPSYFHTGSNADVIPGDLDGDGNEEMILTYSSFTNTIGNDSIVVWAGKADTSFGTHKKLIPNLYLNTGMPILADMNNDGKKDLICQNYNDNSPDYYTDSLFIFLNDSAGGFNRNLVLTTSGNIFSFLMKDFDADNDDDFVYITTEKEFVYLENTKNYNCVNEQANFGYVYTVSGNSIQFRTKHANALSSIWKDFKANNTIFGNNFSLVLVPNDTLTFELSYQFGLGCSDTMYAVIASNDLLNTTGIYPHIMGDNIIEIFPIPATDFITIKNNELGVLTISDIFGNDKQKFNLNIAEPITVNIGNWHSGIYFFNFRTEKSLTSGKLVVK